MNSWVPPRSPFDLLQERFWPDGWKILVTCLLLNQTSRKQVEPMIERFFQRYPSPEVLAHADQEELYHYIKALGLANKRVKTLKRFSQEFLEGNWTSAKDLYGCGKYADDTYRIFIVGDWRETSPNDHALSDYHGWLQSSDNSYNKNRCVEEIWTPKN